MTDNTDNNMTGLSVSVSSVNTDDSWAEITGKIVEQLADGDVPDKVIRATEMILAGWPHHKIAKKLGVTTQTIRGWLSRYPAMAATISQGRALLSKWRMAKLEQQFLSAIERSQEILEIPLDGQTHDGLEVDPKILTVVAAQARYVIGLFAGQQSHMTVTHEAGDTLMKAQTDALDYIAQQLANQQEKAAMEPIEAVFRVVDPKADSGPLLDENGDPPFGKLGELEQSEDGLVCMICGNTYQNLSRHILRAHNTTVDEYETLYMLTEGQIRLAEKGLNQT